MDIQVASNFERLLYDILMKKWRKSFEKLMGEFERNNKLFIKIDEASLKK